MQRVEEGRNWDNNAVFLDLYLASFIFQTINIYNYCFLRNVIALLLLLSHFSRVRLYVTPQTAAHQAPPSLGFSRQEHWSGLPFPSPIKVEADISINVGVYIDVFPISVSQIPLCGEKLGGEMHQFVMFTYLITADGINVYICCIR